MSQNDTIEYGSLITQFTAKAQSTLKSLHPEDDIQFIRIRSKKHEIMIAPEKDYSLIVLQDPSNNDAQHWMIKLNTYITKLNINIIFNI